MLCDAINTGECGVDGESLLGRAVLDAVLHHTRGVVRHGHLGQLVAHILRVGGGGTSALKPQAQMFKAKECQIGKGARSEEINDGV